MTMTEKWSEWDLRLFVEKRPKGGYATNDDWRLHIKDLKEGQEIVWNRHGGFYHSPYAGSFHFTFLEAEDSVRLKITREKEQTASLDFTNKWSSGWYEEADGCEYRLTVSITKATYSVSELPDGVRTMQQTDHDAWEYAVRNGLI